MTRICWWLIAVACRLLEPDEREVVLGDVAESGETGTRALRDVLGLVVRRQAAFWKDWRPWLALVGVVVPFGMLLSLLSRRVADGTAIPIWMYVNNWTWAYVSSSGFRLDLAHSAATVSLQYVTLACWSWTSGFALGVLSRRAIRINGVLFCLVLSLASILGAPRFRSPGHEAVFSLVFYDVMFPLIVQLILVLLPSIWGMRQGMRLAVLPGRMRLFLTSIILATIALLALQYSVPAPPLLIARGQIALAVLGPVFYIVTTATWRLRRGDSVFR
jgi:hypothetical protein